MQAEIRGRTSRIAAQRAFDVIPVFWAHAVNRQSAKVVATPQARHVFIDHRSGCVVGFSIGCKFDLAVKPFRCVRRILVSLSLSCHVLIPNSLVELRRRH